MGFRATSAEEVYRYALRKDDPERFLTDRFGLSIVFVNDNSPACEEFLSRYFVDICHRTAHRIRFIFFANLPSDDVTREANKGVVNGIFNLWRKRRKDIPHSSTQEEVTWKDQLPSALRPIRFPEETRTQMSDKRDTHSVVSGYGESLKFGSYLGIGRDVPCFVLFTDVGSRRFDVMPVQGMSPDEMYFHVRGWVDDYYEQNLAILQRWEDIEKNVISYSNKIQSSLRSIEAWRNRGRDTWQQLTSVCRAREYLEHSPFDTEMDWKQFYGEFRYSPGLSSYLASCDKAFTQLKQREESYKRLGRLIERLENVKGAEAVWNEICALRDKNLDMLEPSYASALGMALDELKVYRDQLKNPASMLFRWVKDIISWCPPLGKFKHERRGWKSVPASDAIPLRENYHFTLELLHRFSLSCEAEQHVATILYLLAQHLEVNPDSPEWQAETVEFRAYLCAYLHRVQTTAPDWLWQRLPDMALNSFFEASAQSQETLQSNHPVQVALQAEQEQCQQDQFQLMQQYEETAEQCVLTLQAYLKNMQMQYAEVPYAGTLIYGRLLTQVNQKRDELEAQVYSQSEVAFPNVSPIASEQVNQLHRILNEYEVVVGRIVYPHHHDPRIRTMNIDNPIVDQLLENNPYRHQSGDTSGGSNSAERETASILNANETLKQTIEQNVGKEPCWTPAALLAECLLEIFKGDQIQARLETLLPANLKGELQYRVREALLQENAVVFLNKLNDHELDDLLQTLDQKNINPDRLPPPRMRDGKIGRILRRVGADTRPPLMGQEAVSRFLVKLTPETIAAMSLEEVRQHGNDLRIKLEQYFKQFLTLHGPLALDEDDQSSLGSKTLGELTSHLISTLKKANAATPLLQGDERWQKIVEKIQTARQQRTWLDSIIRACEDIVSKRGDYAGPANAFSHHNEIPLTELKECLLRFSNSALIIVDALKQAELYPICLRFAGVLPDDLHVCRFEFDSDPSGEQRETVAFSDLPPIIFGMGEDFFTSLYRRTMLMFPLSNPVRIDPLMAFATSE